MTVSDLIEMLSKHNPEMEVVTSYHSDYESLDEELVRVETLVPQDWGFMESHPTMSEENKKKQKQYLAIL